ncbi:MULTISPECIES: Rcs stress response system protein RcsF [unclassified Agarivorans]|uniref:Rcs stress response system protein RcsF n=1 Tax=unclassified Agarivorans TaxID=2636026 RepID=UPI0026E12508|nr:MULTISPECIES: Rcs stress response system protein RcsF [unclassified Agarivorans]MDO6687393.1 Rcs stress response system protein RcsF [Agarivorans sp. 3_MG-2023]MDO6717051.1 Rcs stress response system protein RcsF [Agarivorans sp. 2_MG-2023]
MRFILTAALSLSILGCSGSYSFNTNVDKENFENYVPAADVTVYQAEDIDPLNAEYIGIVEGVSCQEKTNQAPPQEVDARNDLRAQAASVGANAVTVQQCYPIKDPAACIAMMSCFGKAYKI